MTEWLQFFGGVIAGCVTMLVATRVGTGWAVRPMIERVESLERVVAAMSAAFLTTALRESEDEPAPPEVRRAAQQWADGTLFGDDPDAPRYRPGDRS